MPAMPRAAPSTISPTEPSDRLRLGAACRDREKGLRTLLRGRSSLLRPPTPLHRCSRRRHLRIGGRALLRGGLAALLAEACSLGQLGTLGGVVGCHHWVIGRQTPLLAVL